MKQKTQQNSNVPKEYKFPICTIHTVIHYSNVTNMNLYETYSCYKN